jgi:hypothetical protein
MAERKIKKADRKAGFGQGSGSTLIDSVIGSNPIRNLPMALKLELRKVLRLNKGGIVAKTKSKFKGHY